MVQVSTSVGPFIYENEGNRKSPKNYTLGELSTVNVQKPNKCHELLQTLRGITLSGGGVEEKRRIGEYESENSKIVRKILRIFVLQG